MTFRAFANTCVYSHSENMSTIQTANDVIFKMDIPTAYVVHDPCVMTRDLGIVDEARKVLKALGLQQLEPENTKMDTACCGGPVEYAFAELSHKISHLRIEELSGISRNILVSCPICLINLSKYEQELGIRVWDMGELLLQAFQPF